MGCNRSHPWWCSGNDNDAGPSEHLVIESWCPIVFCMGLHDSR